METILTGLAFPEGPRWHVDDGVGRFWFSDMHAHEVIALDPSNGVAEVVVAVPNQPSGLGWLPDGRLLVVSMVDRKVLRREPDGRLVVHADLSGFATFHCNDMVVDAAGRAYVGNFGYDLYDGAAVPVAAAIIRVDTDGSVAIAAPDLKFPNGTVITSDGRTLIVGESGGACLTAFTVGDDGTLRDRRLWAALPKGCVPDGICLDAEGAIWSACPRTGRVLRIAEGGQVLDELQVGAGRTAFACMLGGDDRRTLFVCAATTSHATEAAETRGGVIEQARVDVPGAGLP